MYTIKRRNYFRGNKREKKEKGRKKGGGRNTPVPLPEFAPSIYSIHIHTCYYIDQKNYGALIRN